MYSLISVVMHGQYRVFLARRMLPSMPRCVTCVFSMSSFLKRALIKFDPSEIFVESFENLLLYSPSSVDSLRNLTVILQFSPTFDVVYRKLTCEQLSKGF